MGEYTEEYFINRVKTFYQNVDRDFQEIGAEKLGFLDKYFRLSRVATPIVDYIEIKKILFEIDHPEGKQGEEKGHRRWPIAWMKAVEKFARIAVEAEDQHHQVTAGQNYLRAAVLAHSGQLFTPPAWKEKFELQQKRTRYYQKAAEFLNIKRLSIPTQTIEIPAYLWLPERVKNPPVVIMAPGANSVKEELHRWAAAFVARGLATLTFDGPGQGERSIFNPAGQSLRMETYHQVISSLIDYCHQYLGKWINPAKLALWGQATGGHMITRAYANDRRIKALVNLDGTPTLDSYPVMQGDILEEQRDVLGFKTFLETWQYLQAKGNALEEARCIDIPYLLIHGARNPLFTKEGVDVLMAAVGPTAELWQYEDGNLGVFNHDLEMTDRMADWVVDHL